VHPATVNIIVIGYALPDKEIACLKAVRKNTVHPYLLTFFDNYNSGLTLTQAWNGLIKASPCTFICLLNNDTEAYPHWLERMYESSISIQDCGFIGPSTNMCHSPQRGVSTYQESEKHRGKVIKMKNPISGFCILFKKSIWDLLNGFDERYTLYGQESDLIDRATTHGFYSYWRQDAFVFHHGEASVKASKIDIEKERECAKKLYWSTRK